MKFFQQVGTELKHTNLHESGHICECCEELEHKAQDYHPDDVECLRCKALCCCGCHRDPDTAPKPK